MAQGYATLGTTPTPDAQSIPDLQRVSDKLSNFIGALRAQNDTLSDVIGRVYGEGEATGKELSRPQAAGVVGALNRQMEDIDEAINRHNALLSRLRQLA